MMNTKEREVISVPCAHKVDGASVSGNVNVRLHNKLTLRILTKPARGRTKLIELLCSARTMNDISRSDENNRYSRKT